MTFNQKFLLNLSVGWHSFFWPPIQSFDRSRGWRYLGVWCRFKNLVLPLCKLFYAMRLWFFIGILFKFCQFALGDLEPPSQCCLLWRYTFFLLAYQSKRASNLVIFSTFSNRAYHWRQKPRIMMISPPHQGLGQGSCSLAESYSQVTGFLIRNIFYLLGFLFLFFNQFLLK